MAYVKSYNDNLFPTRGGFLVRAKDDLSEDFFIPFLFNPRPIENKDKANYSEHRIPGRGDPMLQYLQGDAQIITFQLIVEQQRIDEMRTILQRINPNQPAGITPGEGGADFTISDFRQPIQLIEGTAGGSFLPATAREYVELITSLMMPREATDTFVRKSPPRVTFVWGKTVINCVLTRVRNSEEESYEELDLEHSLLDITLKRNDPLFPRKFRGRVSRTNQTDLPRGINQNDLRAAGAVRPQLPAGYQFL